MKNALSPDGHRWASILDSISKEKVSVLTNSNVIKYIRCSKILFTKTVLILQVSLYQMKVRKEKISRLLRVRGRV